MRGSDSRSQAQQSLQRPRPAVSARRHSPQYAGTMFNRVKALQQLGRDDEAAESLSKASGVGRGWEADGAPLTKVLQQLGRGDGAAEALSA